MRRPATRACWSVVLHAAAGLHSMRVKVMWMVDEGDPCSLTGATPK